MVRPITILALLILACAHVIAEDRPNIIFCMADDLGYGDTSYQGHPLIKTPVLDEMARTGLRLDRFYTVAPSCSPSRASCLTGRHHDRTGVYTHSVVMNPDEVTVADALKSVGYAAGHFGKWHLAGHSSNFKGDSHAMLDPKSAFSPAQLGFDYSFGTVNNSRKANPGGFVLNGEPVGNLKGESSHLIIDHATGWMQKKVKNDQPFTAYIWFHTPHAPYGSTPEFLKMYPGEKYEDYYAQITAMDAAMGNLREALRRMRIAENTLLVFCSDNGPGNGGRTQGANGLKGNKKTDPPPHLVPGLIEWPGKVKKPRVVTTPISTCDLYPTFLELAGLKTFGPDRAIDGESFVGLFRGNWQRSAPILGTGTIVSPVGKLQKAGCDLVAWKKSVSADKEASFARIRALGGASKAQLGKAKK